jgi:DNA-binding transcriptional ArsR family regulator
MRLLVVEALCAALISRVPMTVEVESEDGKALAAFSTDDLSIPEIDEVDRQIIESLARGVRTLDPLSEKLGISKPTVWRRLRRLERAGVVKLSKGRRREIAVDITERGRIYCKILSGGCPNLCPPNTRLVGTFKRPLALSLISHLLSWCPPHFNSPSLLHGLFFTQRFLNNP